MTEVEIKSLTYLYQLNLETNSSNENSISQSAIYHVHATDM